MRATPVPLPAGAPAAPANMGRKSAAPILDSPMMSTYPGQVTSHPQWQRPDDLGRPASASLVDPEDDLPSSDYAGDFETTAIPRYKSGVRSLDSA